MNFGVSCPFVPVSSDGAGNAVTTAGPEIRIMANDLHYFFRDSLSLNGKIYPMAERDPSLGNGSLYFEWVIAGEE
jgi:hypothetical protein